MRRLPKIGKLDDPTGLSGPGIWRNGGPTRYAERLGGTVEKASTAITQSQWTPRESSSATYSRDQLDAAFQAMLAEGQKAGRAIAVILSRLAHAAGDKRGCQRLSRGMN